MGFWADDNNSPIDRQTTFAKWIPRGQYIHPILIFNIFSSSLSQGVYKLCGDEEEEGKEAKLLLI